MTQQSLVTFESVREIALALPAVRVRGKYLARLREDGETLVVKRDVGTETNPDAFFITDHYRGYPMLLVRLATVEEDELRDVLELAWRSLAPSACSTMRRS